MDFAGKLLSLALVALLSGSLVGCTKPATEKALEQQTSYLKPLSLIYGQMGRPPKDEAEFKQFVAQQMKAMFRAIEYGSIDELFVSKRDGKPYVILYGKRPEGVPPDLVGYEQEGVDGKRLVGFTLGDVKELNEEEFRQLVPNAT